MNQSRDHWFDLIRMLAIIRVVLFHATGFSWLVLVFPSMGIMFGIGGSLMVRSLVKVGDRPEIMIWGRLRRLVPSVWGLGAVLVPVMLYLGWGAMDSRPFNEAAIIAWILPLSDPPGNDWAAPVTGTLWYIRTYLWLVLLSPLLFAAVKRFPRLTIASPLVLIFCAPHIQWNRWLSDVCLQLGTYTTCWLIGFAHRIQLLDKLTRWATVSLAGTALGAGFGWMKICDKHDLWIQGNSLAQALWCIGFVLLFLRFRPSMNWLEKAVFRSVRWFVGTVNSRAVTIYLWHQLAIVCSDSVLTWMGVWSIGSSAFWILAKATVILALIGAFCVVFGGIEDASGKSRKSRREISKDIETPSERPAYALTNRTPAVAAL